MKHLLTSIALVLIAAGSVHAGVQQPLRCKSTKASAAANLAFQLLQALGTDVRTPNGPKLARSISKSRSRYAKSFSRAEAQGLCSTLDDMEVIKNATDAFVTDMFVGIASQLPLVLDQSAHEDCSSGGSGQILFSQPAGQEFTPSSSPLLAVEVLLDSSDSPYTDTLTLHIREGSVDGPILTTTSSYVGPLERWERFWHRFVFPSPLMLVPGSLYVIELTVTSTRFLWVHVQSNLDSSCDYPGGAAIFNGLRYETTDKLFRTYTLLATP